MSIKPATQVNNRKRSYIAGMHNTTENMKEKVVQYFNNNNNNNIGLFIGTNHDYGYLDALHNNYHAQIQVNGRIRLGDFRGPCPHA